MQFLTSDLFQGFFYAELSFPMAEAPCRSTGAAIAAWRRHEASPLKELLLNNVYFDTCRLPPARDRLARESNSADNILFASEMVGAVKGIDPETGHYFDDTKRYVTGFPGSAPRISERFSRATR